MNITSVDGWLVAFGQGSCQGKGLGGTMGDLVSRRSGSRYVCLCRVHTHVLNGKRTPHSFTLGVVVTLLLK